jgi:hypothetical protein
LGSDGCREVNSWRGLRPKRRVDGGVRKQAEVRLDRLLSSPGQSMLDCEHVVKLSQNVLKCGCRKIQCCSIFGLPNLCSLLTCICMCWPPHLAQGARTTSYVAPALSPRPTKRLVNVTPTGITSATSTTRFPTYSPKQACSNIGAYPSWRHGQYPSSSSWGQSVSVSRRYVENRHFRHQAPHSASCFVI